MGRDDFQTASRGDPEQHAWRSQTRVRDVSFCDPPALRDFGGEGQPCLIRH